jgi:hypothetical protein
MRFYTLLTFLVYLYVVVANTIELPSLLDATIDDLVRLLDAGTISSVDLVNAYISRIAEVNDRLHAVMEVNPTALEAARVSDLERAEASLLKQPLGLLHGVPILVGQRVLILFSMISNNPEDQRQHCYIGYEQHSRKCLHAWFEAEAGVTSHHQATQSRSCYTWQNEYV